MRESDRWQFGSGGQESESNHGRRHSGRRFISRRYQEQERLTYKSTNSTTHKDTEHSRYEPDGNALRGTPTEENDADQLL